MIRIDWAWLQIMLFPRHRSGWFRIFGWGIGLTDHRIDRPLFSERYNGLHGVRKRRYVHIGPFCVRSLA